MSGFTFGATAAANTSQPSFGLSTATTTAATGTLFGGTSLQTATSVPSFGTGGLFGTTKTATTTTASTLFGTTPAAPAFGTSSFGSTTRTTTLPSFGTSSSIFSKPATNTGFGFGNTQQQQQQQQAIQQQNQVPLTSLFCPKIFNDERDQIIGMFNTIQAFWGTGKAFYSAFNPPYEFDESVPFNRFKAIGYSEIDSLHSEKDKREQVLFLIKYANDETQLKTNLLTYEQNFKQLVGNNFTVKLELKALLPDSKALISVNVTENATGKVIPDSQLIPTFTQWKPQFTQVFGGNFIELLFTSLSKKHIEEYLKTPPKGIDERIWEQAKLENPDPERFIPVPLIGFNALNNRFKLQEKEIHKQQAVLKQLIDDVTGIESDLSQFKAKYEECRRKHDNLSYQVLKKMIAQEVRRKRTLPIQAEEDKLRANLEAIQSELNVPTKFQGCLNELMSQLRQMQCQNHLAVSKTVIDEKILNEYRQFLAEENEGIMKLVEILKKDLQDIQKFIDHQKKIQN